MRPYDVAYPGDLASLACSPARLLAASARHVNRVTLQLVSIGRHSVKMFRGKGGEGSGVAAPETLQTQDYITTSSIDFPRPRLEARLLWALGSPPAWRALACPGVAGRGGGMAGGLTTPAESAQSWKAENQCLSTASRPAWHEPLLGPAGHLLLYPVRERL